MARQLAEAFLTDARAQVDAEQLAEALQAFHETGAPVRRTAFSGDHGESRFCFVTSLNLNSPRVPVFRFAGLRFPGLEFEFNHLATRFPFGGRSQIRKCVQEVSKQVDLKRMPNLRRYLSFSYSRQSGSNRRPADYNQINSPT
jgi:hypothetical protein